MGERFGKRWLDEYGDAPTFAWRQMLDKYTPSDISGALELMATRGWQHPPTQPQFEALLVRAANENKPDEQDWIRSYWRSVIADQVARDFWLGIVIPSMSDFEQYLIQHADTLGMQLSALLNHMDDLEKKTGQRTDGMHEHVRKSSFEITLGFSPYFRQLLQARKDRSAAA